MPVIYTHHSQIIRTQFFTAILRSWTSFNRHKPWQRTSDEIQSVF